MVLSVELLGFKVLWLGVLRVAGGFGFASRDARFMDTRVDKHKSYIGVVHRRTAMSHPSRIMQT